MTTTKRDLARAVAQKVWCSFPEALALVDAVVAEMLKDLSQGDRIEVRGFGVLEVREARARPQGRNPKTGEIVYVPARRRVHFRPGKVLREALHRPLCETKKIIKSRGILGCPREFKFAVGDDRAATGQKTPWRSIASSREFMGNIYQISSSE